MTAHPASQDIKVAVDAVIFTVMGGRLNVLLIKMKKAPYAGRWAFPGGLMADGESAEDAARRILSEQTGVKQGYLEQLRTFDALKRDRLGRVISIAHFAVIPADGIRLQTTKKYDDVRWWSVDGLPQLAYDHGQMAAYAIARLRAKLGYTNVAWSVLPPTFVLSELQAVYEAILGKAMDKRNFRKKMIQSGLIKSTGKHKAGGAHRPAELYRFRTRESVIANLFN